MPRFLGGKNRNVPFYEKKYYGNPTLILCMTQELKSSHIFKILFPDGEG
jgi:hypothetical protein